MVPIPSHNQYSSRIKKHLWSNAMEIKEMAQRNYFEFQSEGFDWRNVVLDEEMYIDSMNGQLVHPCHLSAATHMEESHRLSSQYDHSSAPCTATQQQQQQDEKMETQEEEEEEGEDLDGPCFVALQRRSSEIFSQYPTS